MKSPVLKILVAALALAAGSAMAQGYGYGPGNGRGMGGGWGAEEGWAPGMGYGSGMGYGPGRGYGPGANLTDEQRTKIAALQEQHRAKNWQAMGELRAEQFKLREMSAAKADAKAIAAQQKKVDGLREQMFKRRNDLHREMDAVLAN